ncbi:MAG TPA: ribbon-helix-helix domain-containing protein [bacterium]|nr:ribbon-helix-helix domain-containing protein [bacterium]
MKTLSITIEDSLLKELDRSIEEVSGGGRSEVVREAIRDWLKKLSIRKKIAKEIEGYRKKPVKEDEFGPLIASQGLGEDD